MISLSGASEAIVLAPVSGWAGLGGCLAFFFRRRRGPFFRAARSPEDAPRNAENAIGRLGSSGRHFAEHFHTGGACRNFAQGGDGGFILGVQAWFMTLGEFAGAIRRNQGQVEAIGD